MGIRDKPIAPASPWQKGFAERLIGSVRRECLDHIIVGTNAISDECPDTGCPKVAAAGTGTALASRGDAARCADDIQRSFAEHNFDVPLNKRIEMRIGVHAGDIIIDENDIFGDAVNIAVRLEEIAEPGGVCIYDDARRQVRGKIDIAFDDIGWQSLKNIRDAVRAWRVRPVQATGAGSDEYRAPQDKPFIAVLPFQNVSDDTKQEHLADGIVEEITTGLGRIRWLSVIARNSTLAYGGRTVDVRQIGRELGRGMCLRGACVRKGIEFG
jgi:adenylate cyclase